MRGKITGTVNIMSIRSKAGFQPIRLVPTKVTRIADATAMTPVRDPVKNVATMATGIKHQSAKLKALLIKEVCVLFPVAMKIAMGIAIAIMTAISLEFILAPEKRTPCSTFDMLPNPVNSMNTEK